jgi:hypothetical protein
MVEAVKDAMQHNSWLPNDREASRGKADFW